MSYEKSFSGKFHSILDASFTDMNELKRAYLILSETNSESVKEKHENVLFRAMLNIELNLRKLQKINSALSYQETEIVAEKKNSYTAGTGSHLRSV